jgi:hypothetical protein
MEIKNKIERGVTMGMVIHEGMRRTKGTSSQEFKHNLITNAHSSSSHQAAVSIIVARQSKTSNYLGITYDTSMFLKKTMDKYYTEYWKQIMKYMRYTGKIR